MRKVVIGLILLAFALPAFAKDSYYPRDTLVYAELRGGYELQELTDISSLSNVGREFRWLTEDLERSKTVRALLLDDFEQAEFAITNIRMANVPIIWTATLRYTKDRSIVDLQKLIPKIVELEALTYRGYEYISSAKEGEEEDRGEEIAIAFLGKEVVLGSRLSDVKQVIDRSLDGVDEEESLTSNPRYKNWKASTPAATGRAFLDGKGMIRVLERLVGDGEDRKVRELKQALTVFKMLELNKTEYISAHATPGVRGRAGASIVFSEMPALLNSTPPAGGLSMLKYVPENADLVFATHLGDAQELVDSAMNYLGSMEEKAAKEKGLVREGRDLFGSRKRSAARWFRDMDEALVLAWKIHAVEVVKKGHASWSGTGKELAEMLEKPGLLKPILGFKLKSISDLSWNKAEESWSGTISYIDEDGMGARIKLAERDVETAEDLKAMWGEELPDPLPEPRLVNMSYVAQGAIDTAMLVAGMTRDQANSCLGDNLMVSHAVSPVPQFDWWHTIQPFSGPPLVAMHLSKPKVIESRVVEILQMFPEARAEVLKEESDGSFSIRYNYKNKSAKAISVDRYIAMAITDDAFLFGSPGVIAAVLEGKTGRHFSDLGVDSSTSATAVYAMDLSKLSPTEYEYLPWFIDSGSNWSDLKFSVSLQANSMGVSIDAQHNISKAQQIVSMDDGSIWRNEREARSLAAYHKVATGVYELRLADEDPDNDTFPSLKETIDSTGKNIDEDGNPIDGEEDEWRRAMTRSNRFNVSMVDAWELLPPVKSPPEITGSEAKNPAYPLGVLAISRNAIEGRYLAAFGEDHLISLSDEMVTLLKKAREKGTYDPSDFYIDRKVKVSKATAALWLRNHWLRDGLNELRQRAREKQLERGDSFHIESIGDVTVLGKDKDVWEVKIEGYGHWMEYDSLLGVVGASWLQDDTESDGD